MTSGDNANKKTRKYGRFGCDAAGFVLNVRFYVLFVFWVYKRTVFLFVFLFTIVDKQWWQTTGGISMHHIYFNLFLFFWKFFFQKKNFCIYFNICKIYLGIMWLCKKHWFQHKPSKKTPTYPPTTNTHKNTSFWWHRVQLSPCYRGKPSMFHESVSSVSQPKHVFTYAATTTLNGNKVFTTLLSIVHGRSLRLHKQIT